MKKNKIILIIFVFLVLLTSGCTKILKDSENKVVTNPQTGQSLPSNILCQPTDEETIKKYTENGIDINTLPTCDEFKPFSTYDGVWSTVFVKSLAWLILFIGRLVKNYGIAVIIITILIRVCLIPITNKTAVQSENMKKIKPDMDNLEKKYKEKTDKESQMLKSQEMMAIYKKNGISPLSGCLFSLIQIPLFFAFYEGMQRLPVIFEESFLSFQLGTSPLKAFASGQYQYIIFIILVIASTYFSFKFNPTASTSPEQEKQMKLMSNMMIIFIGFASLSIPTGIALYWIFNSGFTILQNLLVKRRKENGKIIKKIRRKK